MAIVEIKIQDEKVNEISFVNVMATGNNTHTHMLVLMLHQNYDFNAFIFGPWPSK